MTPWLLTLAILGAELEHAVPPGLLAAVVMAESDGKWQVNRERQGGCSVGPAQVYHERCTSQVRRRRNLEEHLAVAAAMLRRSHERCLLHPRWRACRLSSEAWLTGLYNGGSVTWGPRVAEIWRRLYRAPKRFRVPEVS